MTAMTVTIGDMTTNTSFGELTTDADLGGLLPLILTITLFGLTPPNAIPPGSAPPSQPQPGTPGGGGLPASNIAAAALAPVGLLPVAVFPPFTFPPRVPVKAVIFSEDPPQRKKRDTYHDSFSDSHYEYEKPSIFTTLGRGKILYFLKFH